MGLGRPNPQLLSQTEPSVPKTTQHDCTTHEPATREVSNANGEERKTDGVERKTDGEERKTDGVERKTGAGEKLSSLGYIHNLPLLCLSASTSRSATSADWYRSAGSRLVSLRMIS